MRLDKISREMGADRLWIPNCNRKKYDAEARSYLEEMKIADEKRLQELIVKWRCRVDWLRNHPRAFIAPPLLCQKIGETEQDYWDRCHEAGGFYYAE